MSWMRTVRVVRAGLLGLVLVGFAWPGLSLAKHKAEHEEVPGICPQPRQTPDAPADYLLLKNPLEATPQNILAGKTLFQFDAQPTACRVCHGISGDGLGIMFRRVKTKPRNFTCYQTMDDLPDGQLYWVIKNGSPGTAMPSFNYLADEQVWQLILYLRSFSTKK